jgi:uncharacterized alpha/beta hydrolase family protein
MIWLAPFKLWLKKWFGWAWSPFTLVAMLAGAYAIKRSRDNSITKLKDALAVERGRREVVAGQARVEVLTEQAREKGKAIHAAREKVLESKRRVVRIEGDTLTEEMTDDEIAKKFSDLKL